ncbi:MAG: ATP-dependent DNA helicase RecG, partial [Atopobiaceae bacterium]|nr:ATP-dependent DNA helicase RecG [Atopobiaceae bacterium]
MERTVDIASSSERLGRTLSLNDSPQRLRYVSGKRAEVLDNMGIHRIRDLLLNTPRRYLDFTDVSSINMLSVGKDATVVGTVDEVKTKRPRPRMSIVEVSILDGTGVLMAVFFRQPWVAEQLHEGDIVAFSGKVGFAYRFMQMNSPFYEVLGNAGESANHARILPVHPTSEGMSAAWMRRIISAALADAGDIADYLPSSISASIGLMSRARALREIHFPVSLDSAEMARSRLAFDELFCLQVALRTIQNRELQGAAAPVQSVDGPPVRALRDALPFSLTDEQETCVSEMLADMASPYVMNRLLLGDVGTGKTAVAAFGLAACADSGMQAAMMAPTSVLASQYARSLGPLLDAAGIPWALLLGSTPASERASIGAGIADGSIPVVFGTTALLSDDIVFHDLGLVVVDEQHRFGVDQRSALGRKGRGADMLAMSATPIPRTLALPIYGHMSCSRITKRPRAGAGVETHAITPENIDLAYGAIRDRVARGQQAYVVCPLIDDSDTGDDMSGAVQDAPEEQVRMHSATAVHDELSRYVFPDMRIGLLTGRMSAQEKDDVMGAFRNGEIDVLVSTTVIEVGVDVPNACVMLVYDADRFGLATLHQLRGRVGRGDTSGEVWLCAATKEGTTARRRLDALERTTDGLELAELDLKLRHEGEMLGYRQHGGVTLTLVDLARDTALVEAAHRIARDIVRIDPLLVSPEHQPIALEVQDRFDDFFEGKL